MRSHQRLARLADRQHGIVSARQLNVLGYSRSAIGRATRAGRLHRIHRGVYAVGHSELSQHGRCLAAVAACGPNALLSHAAAAWLWGLASSCPTLVDVTVSSRGHRRSGIRLHHAPGLAAADRAKYEGVPVTAVHRLLLDLAATGSASQLDHAIERAERRGLLDLGEIDAMLRRRGGYGIAPLEKALDLYRDPAFSRAKSELLFLDLVREAGLPRPALNTYVAGHEIDAYWEAERFAVEVDGWDTHRTRAAFESDPLRQEDLKLAGIDSIRVTARRIEREPKRVGERLTRLLARRRAELSR